MPRRFPPLQATYWMSSHCKCDWWRKRRASGKLSNPSPRARDSAVFNDLAASTAPIYHQNETINQRSYGTSVGNRAERWQIDDDVIEAMTRRRKHGVHTLVWSVT